MMLFNKNVSHGKPRTYKPMVNHMQGISVYKRKMTDARMRKEFVLETASPVNPCVYKK